MAKHSRAIYFFAVLIVVVSNVVFAPDWQSGPLSPMPKFKVSTYETPATPANTDGPNAALSKTVVTPNTSTKDNTNTPVAQTPSQSSAIDDTNTPVEQTSSQPKCDISACTSAYHSFRESDCTYQPSTGPRRLCRKGVVASDSNGAPDAASTLNTDPDANPQSNVRCSVNACAAVYRSFNPSDCTYQPSDGPRRLCAK
jgi:hypothetical protein